MVGSEASRSPEQSMSAVSKSSTCSKVEGRRSNCGRSGTAPGGGHGVRSMQLPENLYERLRHLAVEDPREARTVFLQLLDSGGHALDHFLGQISSAGDGRLRQLVANALRNHRDRERLAPHLIAWHEIETDEFTRRAIAAVLDGLDTRSA